MAGKPDFGIRQMPMMRNPRGSLGEYNDRLLERQIASPAGTGESLGPASYPISGTEPQTNEEYLAAMYQLLKGLPYDLVMELRRQLLLIPREVVPTPGSARDVALASGATVTVCTVNMDEAFNGFLEFVGFGCTPEAGQVDLRWQLVIDNVVHPKWSAFVAPGNSMSTPYKVMMELRRSQNISIVCTNVGANNLLVHAYMLVNAEVQMQKPWGQGGGGIV
jgi:hypothetical protein